MPIRLQAIAGDWWPSLIWLLNRQELGEDNNLRKTVMQEIRNELLAKSVPKKEALQEAKEFGQMLSLVQSELVRLWLKKSNAFKQCIGCLLTCEELKECVYHLSSIDPEPLDADRLLSRNPDGTVSLKEAEDFGYSVTNHLLYVRHYDRLVASVELSLAEAKKQEKVDTQVVDQWTALLVRLKEYEKDIAVASGA